MTAVQQRRGTRRVLLGGSALVCTFLLYARSASALQPIATFLRAARAYNPDDREARATSKQRDAEADSATARLFPSLSANGTYTRNQYEVAIILPAVLGGTGSPLKLQPKDQLDGSIGASVPVINIGLWEKRAAARATAKAAVAGEKATELDVAREVALTYYQLLGSEAVLRSANKSLDLAKQTAKITQTKREGGTASELDVRRAQADLARTEENVVTAELAIVNTRHSLTSLTGVEPTAVTEFPIDDLHNEAPLAKWLEQAPYAPIVAAAHASSTAAQKNADAAKAAWLPTLSAAAQERFTNATSFAGHSNFYLLQGVASWQLDGTIPANVRAQNAATAGAHAREDKARINTTDSIFGAWQQIQADIEKAKSARIQADATALAADLASTRYAEGIATQLDLLQARQDAFTADLSLIRAYADLAYSRAALRFFSGHRLDAEPLQ